MKYLVVGLGNIGPEYRDTRHNVGFKVLDCYVEQSGIFFKDERYGAVTRVKYRGRQLVFLKPSTFMNLSG
jgi:PTH1 family peptidyl-tRNA hydrolase